MARREPKPGAGEESAVPVVPAPKFRVTGADVTDSRKTQLGFYIVVVVIENRAAIDSQRSLADGALEMQVLDSAENVARHSVLLFELRIVAPDVHAADPQFDPVLGRLFLNRGAILVDRSFIIARAHWGNSKDERKRENNLE